jgi:hypothetical protein
VVVLSFSGEISLGFYSGQHLGRQNEQSKADWPEGTTKTYAGCSRIIATIQRASSTELPAESGEKAQDPRFGGFVHNAPHLLFGDNRGARRRWTFATAIRLPPRRRVRGMLQSYHEHGISTPECLLIELNQPLLLRCGKFGF